MTDTHDLPLPRRLSGRAGHRDFHPSFMRVGLRIDGIHRTDIAWYDADANRYLAVGDRELKEAQSIEPHWRYPENRQQRRARERWESKHGYAMPPATPSPSSRAEDGISDR